MAEHVCPSCSVDPDDVCVHCGSPCEWINDPAPDLCARCAIAGLWSPQWTPEQASGYRAMLRRLSTTELAADEERETEK